MTLAVHRYGPLRFNEVMIKVYPVDGGNAAVNPLKSKQKKNRELEELEQCFPPSCYLSPCRRRRKTKLRTIILFRHGVFKMASEEERGVVRVKVKVG